MRSVYSRINPAIEGIWKVFRERAMHTYLACFAFTYRFSFTGERAGETRADEAGS